MEKRKNFAVLSKEIRDKARSWDRVGDKGGTSGAQWGCGGGLNAPKNTWERTISSGSVGSQQSPSAARNRGSSLPSDTPKSCSTPTAGSPLHRSVPRQNKKGMHISYKWPNSQAKKTKHHWNQESSSSTFIAAIQRFNNATKGLLTLKGVWGGRGEMLGFFLGT